MLKESDHYFPILVCLKAAGGKSELGALRESVGILLRADHDYLNGPSGPKTMESRFEKDFNWAGKRLSDAGLVKKLRTHWALTEKAQEMTVTGLLHQCAMVG